MELSIITVNFNAGDFIVNCIQNLLKNYEKEFGEKRFEIIVVDNNSTDGSIDLLKKIDGITLIENSENLGFSKANNIGVRKSQGRYILFLNPDTIVPQKSISALLSFMDSNKEAGASTCKLILPNGKIDEASHRGFPTPWNAFTYFAGLSKIFPRSPYFSGYYQGWKDLDSIHEIDSLVGAFMLVRREAGEEAGWWDEDYFFYGEDIDFCFMLKEKGWKIFYYPKVTALHFKGITSGIKKISKDITTADTKTKRLAIKHRYNAMKLFYDKHYLKRYPGIVTMAVKKAIDVKLFLSLARL